MNYIMAWHKRSAKIRSTNYQFKTKVNMKNRTSILVGTRYFFYALLATALFSSCGGSTDKEACLSNVKEMFPKAKVYIPFEGSNTTFIVVDSVNVYMVKTMSLTSPRVTDVVVLRSK